VLNGDGELGPLGGFIVAGKGMTGVGALELGGGQVLGVALLVREGGQVETSVVRAQVSLVVDRQNPGGADGESESRPAEGKELPCRLVCIGQFLGHCTHHSLLDNGGRKVLQLTGMDHNCRSFHQNAQSDVYGAIKDSVSGVHIGAQGHGIMAGDRVVGQTVVILVGEGDYRSHIGILQALQLLEGRKTADHRCLCGGNGQQKDQK